MVNFNHSAQVHFIKKKKLFLTLKLFKSKLTKRSFQRKTRVQ